LDTRRRKLRFAWIDILLCIIAVFGVLAYLLAPRGTPCSAEYTVLFTLPSAYADAIGIGDGMLDGVKKGMCGHVTHIEKEDAFTETHRGVLAVEGKTRLTVTVRGEGKLKNGVLTVGSITPVLGKTLCFHAPCVMEGVCLGATVTEVTI
jgi:hypothetical protein